MRSLPRLKLLCLVVVLFPGLPARAKAKPATLIVHIAIDKSSLADAVFTSRGLFFVKARIKNVGSNPVQIVTWTQSGWSWVSSNKFVIPNINALKNYPTKTMLKAGEVYSYGADLFCYSRNDKPITFKLGFVPDAKLPVSTAVPGIAQSNRVIWSNAVTLHRRCPTFRATGRQPATRVGAG
jgi:hypothetical protein